MVTPSAHRDRVDRAWRARCERGNLGNRVTCPCGHCATWRLRDAGRLDRIAAVSERGNAHARAVTAAARAWRAQAIRARGAS